MKALEVVSLHDDYWLTDQGVAESVVHVEQLFTEALGDQKRFFRFLEEAYSSVNTVISFAARAGLNDICFNPGPEGEQKRQVELARQMLVRRPVKEVIAAGILRYGGARVNWHIDQDKAQGDLAHYQLDSVGGKIALFVDPIAELRIKPEALGEEVRRVEKGTSRSPEFNKSLGRAVRILLNLNE